LIAVTAVGTAQPERGADGQWRQREQQALDELGRTSFARGTRTFLISAFLAMIVLVPLIEIVTDYRTTNARRQAMIAAHAPPSTIPGRRPHVLDVFALVASPQAFVRARWWDQWKHLLPSGQVLRGYANGLVNESSVGKVIRPWVQWVLTGWLKIGSQQVIYGNDGYLFMRDGVSYVLDPGFLEPAQLERRAEVVDAPDPRPAIYQLNEELKSLGTVLVLLPLPEKAVVHPSALARGERINAPVQNPSWNAFTADLRRHGVLFLDLAGKMYDADRSGAVQFTPGDTHWTPAGVELVASELSAVLKSQPGVNSAPARSYGRRDSVITTRNDLVYLLNLPPSRAEDFGLFTPKMVHQVIDAGGAVWRPDSSSGILLIGDSFVEAYSVGMWGGLSEQVSYFLQRSVDRRGAHEPRPLDVREQLGASLAEVRNNAKRRRIIVWEFAMRKLAVGDWPLLK
jgi:alginate O-acetyltransferase complex protein AlgJ